MKENAYLNQNIKTAQETLRVSATKGQQTISELTEYKMRIESFAREQ